MHSGIENMMMWQRSNIGRYRNIINMVYYFVSCMAINTVIYDIYYSMILYMHYEGTYVVSYTSIICMILYIVYDTRHYIRLAIVVVS